jgi:cupin superfamily protein
VADAWTIRELSLDNQGLVNGGGTIFAEATDEHPGTRPEDGWIPWRAEWGIGLKRVIGDPWVFRRSWPQTPLFGEKMDYTKIFDIKELCALVDYERVPASSIRVIQKGRAQDSQFVTRERRLGPRGFGGNLDRAWLAGAVADRGTLALQGLEGHHDPARKLCTDLGTDLECMVTSTAFYSSAHSPGFPAHYDTHHVLLLQIAGSKEWRVSPPPFPDPLPEHTSSERQASLPDFKLIADDAPVNSYRLTAGCYLWIPRGWVHRGESGDTGSLHVTLGITPLDHSWLLRQLVDDLAEAPAFRRYFPPRWSSNAAPSEIDRFTQNLCDTLGKIDSAAVAARIREYSWFASAGQPARFLSAMTSLERLTTEATDFRINHHAIVAWRTRDELIEIHCGDRIGLVPPRAQPLIDLLRSTDRVYTEDIARLAPDDRVHCTRFLLRLGLLEVDR